MGLALFAAAALVRFGGRALGRYVFLLGGLASIYLASQQWQASQSWLYAGGLLIVGLAASAVVAWIVRAVSFVVALALFVAAWYVILYGWMGADFLTTTVGSISWVAAVVLSLMATDRLSRRSVRRTGVASRIASSAVGGPSMG